MLGVAFFRTGVAHKVIVSMSWIPIAIMATLGTSRAVWLLVANYKRLA
jgi:hypothetical protein